MSRPTVRHSRLGESVHRPQEGDVRKGRAFANMASYLDPPEERPNRLLENTQGSQSTVYSDFRPDDGGCSEFPS